MCEQSALSLDGPFEGLAGMLAGSTGLEPAASGVTGRRSNQLNYDPDIELWWAVQDSNL